MVPNWGPRGPPKFNQIVTIFAPFCTPGPKWARSRPGVQKRLPKASKRCQKASKRYPKVMKKLSTRCQMRCASNKSTKQQSNDATKRRSNNKATKQPSDQATKQQTKRRSNNKATKQPSNQATKQQSHKATKQPRHPGTQVPRHPECFHRASKCNIQAHWDFYTMSSSIRNAISPLPPPPSSSPPNRDQHPKPGHTGGHQSESGRAWPRASKCNIQVQRPATANAMANAVTDHGTVAGRPKASGYTYMQH